MCQVLKCCFFGSHSQESWCQRVERLQVDSLVGSFYKFLAKVLANGLEKVIGKLITKSQKSFS